MIYGKYLQTLRSETKSISLKTKPPKGPFGSILMRKALLLLPVITFLHYYSSAQLRIAIAGGGHTASVKETNNLPGWSELENKYSARTGAHFGFMADLQLGPGTKFYFQPGVLFYNKGRKFANTYDTSLYDYFSIDAIQYVNYIDVPLNILYKYPVGQKAKIFIGAGPLLSFFYNGREKTETFMKTGTVTTEENTDLPVGDGPGKYKTIDFGVNALAGIEIGKIFLAANFSRGVSDFYKAAYEGSFRHQVIGGTLGIFLGKPQTLEPKIRDKDGDGVVDAEDICPEEAGPAITNGCPDRDADGIADRADKCPLEKGLAKYNGCPPTDTDSDGVNDEEDKCIDVPGKIAYSGCPVPDTDKDGINDEEDKCIDQPGIARYNGCPIPDTDGDGLNNEEDKCPDVAGTKENSGCPAVEKEIIEKVEYAAKRIQFKFAKADLLPESKKVLDEVVEILQKNPDINLEIEGHTSNDGNYNANMKLSDDRAKAVKSYIAGKGIDVSRLTALGFGPDRPLNNGRTEVEKALNRRVELKPVRTP